MRTHPSIRTPASVAKAAALLAVTASFALAAAPLHAGGSKSEANAEKQQVTASEMNRAVRDAWLDGKLESAILFNEHLNSFAIDTRVEHATAYLTGTVESDIDRELAGEVARSVEGISEVKNELNVDASSYTYVQSLWGLYDSRVVSIAVGRARIWRASARSSGSTMVIGVLRTDSRGTPALSKTRLMRACAY